MTENKIKQTILHSWRNAHVTDRYQKKKAAAILPALHSNQNLLHHAVGAKLYLDEAKIELASPCFHLLRHQSFLPKKPLGRWLSDAVQDFILFQTEEARFHTSATLDIWEHWISNRLGIECGKTKTMKQTIKPLENTESHETINENMQFYTEER